ncbi:MAG TPA: hypothetical protein VGN57_16215 [Pirellulaceae bacterium]|jgi:hypothetical protein|nr:hypothetical protein [Pirellulaceae bacterium]
MTRAEPVRAMVLQEAMRIVRNAGYAIVPAGSLGRDEKIARLSPRERQMTT